MFVRGWPRCFAIELLICLCLLLSTTVTAFVSKYFVGATLSSSIMGTDAMLSAENAQERLEFWSQRWDAQNIGWHENDVHESIKLFGNLFIPGFDKTDDTCTSAPVRVFVPLCGKSLDMAYFASLPGISQVVGIDGVRKALEEFNEEHPDLNIKSAGELEATNASYQKYMGDKISLLQGDFFLLDSVATEGHFDMVYDRASMVAIQPSLREAYVQVIGNVVKPGAKILLVTIERTGGDLAAGPPFSIPESEVRRLYESQNWVESVTLLYDNGEQARNAGKDMKSLYFLIQAKS